MRKSIFTAESQFSGNWVLTAQIDAKAVSELRSLENQFLRPNRNFQEIGCSRPKSTQKRSPSSDHEKINFYGRIAIFRKLGAHGPNRRTSGPRAQIMRKSIFTAVYFHVCYGFHRRSGPLAQIMRKFVYGRIAIFTKLGAHVCLNRRTSGPRSSDHETTCFLRL